MMDIKTKIFTKSDVQSLLSLSECIEVVEQAFESYSNGNIIKPDLLHSDVADGEFHIKVGGIISTKSYFGLKCNGGFFGNKAKYDLPNIQGLILLYDGENGSPLAVFESGEITIQRTGAATAVAAKHLSLENSDTVTICGCGIQGQIQLKALQKVRNIQKVFAYDLDKDLMNFYCNSMSSELKLDVLPVDDLGEAISKSQICITCTPSREFFIKKEFVHAGLFIAAVGADSPDKHEIDPYLLAENKVVVDILDQCASVGELHHAIDNRLMTKNDVHAELGNVITNKSPGRTSEEEIIIYDATGTALQDVAPAAFIYEKSNNSKIGRSINFKD